MPIYEFGNMWAAYDQSSLFLVTANAYIRKDGALVMGRGIAKEAKERFPGIDHAYGALITKAKNPTGGYGVLLPSDIQADHKVGLFQVKHHFRSRASRRLISLSRAVLWAMAIKELAGMRIDLNFPGIGNGQLAVDQVKPMIDVLPRNVHIWRFRNEER